jgi:hypothetical protein
MPAIHRKSLVGLTDGSTAVTAALSRCSLTQGNSSLGTSRSVSRMASNGAEHNYGCGRKGGCSTYLPLLAALQEVDHAVLQVTFGELVSTLRSSKSCPSGLAGHLLLQPQSVPHRGTPHIRDTSSLECCVCSCLPGKTRAGGESQAD